HSCKTEVLLADGESVGSAVGDLGDTDDGGIGLEERLDRRLPSRSGVITFGVTGVRAALQHHGAAPAGAEVDFDGNLRRNQEVLPNCLLFDERQDLVQPAALLIHPDGGAAANRVGDHRIGASRSGEELVGVVVYVQSQADLFEV